MKERERTLALEEEQKQDKEKLRRGEEGWVPAQLFLGPDPGQARWGLTDRIKDFSTMVQPFLPLPPVVSGSLSRPDEELEVQGGGSNPLRTQSV